MLGAATAAPARVLRLDGTLGGLEPGCWADVLLLDKGLGVLQTWVGGVLGWSSTGAGASNA